MKNPPLSDDELDQITEDIIDQLLNKAKTDVEQIWLIKMVMDNMFKWVILHHARIAHLAQKHAPFSFENIEHLLRTISSNHETLVEEMLNSLRDKTSPFYNWLETINENNKNNIH